MHILLPVSGIARFSNGHAIVCVVASAFASSATEMAAATDHSRGSQRCGMAGEVPPVSVACDVGQDRIVVNIEVPGAAGIRIVITTTARTVQNATVHKAIHVIES